MSILMYMYHVRYRCDVVGRLALHAHSIMTCTVRASEHVEVFDVLMRNLRGRWLPV